MDSSKLTVALWNETRQQVQDTVTRINQRNEVSVSGRVVPEDDHLAIGTGSRMKLAVLFLDICGFSSWESANHEDQDNVLRVLNLFITQMIHIAEHYGGTIEKNTGDGLMVYFPSTSSGDLETAKTAIAAALTMFYTNENLINPVLTKGGFNPIQFRVGIDFGPVTIARVGALRKFSSNVAIGAIANCANKMLIEAGPNQIVIGNELRLLLPEADKHTKFLKVSSRFKYIGTTMLYPLYLYTSRWTRPL
jgi:adenylate cyclase